MTRSPRDTPALQCKPHVPNSKDKSPIPVLLGVAAAGVLGALALVWWATGEGSFRAHQTRDKAVARVRGTTQEGTPDSAKPSPSATDTSDLVQPWQRDWHEFGKALEPLVYEAWSKTAVSADFRRLRDHRGLRLSMPNAELNVWGAISRMFGTSVVEWNGTVRGLTPSPAGAERALLFLKMEPLAIPVSGYRSDFKSEVSGYRSIVVDCLSVQVAHPDWEAWSGVQTGSTRRGASFTSGGSLPSIIAWTTQTGPDAASNWITVTMDGAKLVRVIGAPSAPREPRREVAASARFRSGPDVSTQSRCLRCDYDGTMRVAQIEADVPGAMSDDNAKRVRENTRQYALVDENGRLRKIILRRG